MTVDCPPDCYVAPTADDLLAILNFVTGQVGSVKQRTPLEPAGDAHQLRGGHSLDQGVGTGFQHFAADGYAGRVGLIPAPDTDGVEGLQVERSVAGENIGDAE